MHQINASPHVVGSGQSALNFGPKPENIARREQIPPRGSELFLFFLNELPDLSRMFP